jgi:mono/diheme cytochrome c family protein
MTHKGKGDFQMKKHISHLIILFAAPLLMAAIWMDDQQSYKAYEAPVLAPPAGSVPVSGKELVSQETELKNPVTATAASLSEGKILFDTNCAMCHGHTSAERGPVGKKLVPPPPGLDPNLVRSRSDSHIFKAITFGFGRMPRFQDKLTPEERWSLVNFLRTRQ